MALLPQHLERMTSKANGVGGKRGIVQLHSLIAYRVPTCRKACVHVCGYLDSSFSLGGAWVGSGSAQATPP